MPVLFLEDGFVMAVRDEWPALLTMAGLSQVLGGDVHGKQIQAPCGNHVLAVSMAAVCGRRKQNHLASLILRRPVLGTAVLFTEAEWFRLPGVTGSVKGGDTPSDEEGMDPGQ